MPSGVYPRQLPETYRGFPRIRQVPTYNGEGSNAVCSVQCQVCGKPIERSARAIRLAAQEGRGFTCRRCNIQRTLRVRGKKGDA